MKRIIKLLIIICALFITTNAYAASISANASKTSCYVGDNVTVNDVRNAKIYKVIIGPEDMIKTKSLLLEKGINLETYKFMTIKSNSSYFEFSVNQKEKLFEINRVK